MKKIAVLGAGIYNVHVYEKLRKGGFYTIAIDGNPNAPARNFADEYINLNFVDKYRLLEFLRECNIDGVMPLNDWGTISAAFVTTELGLPGISEDSAFACCDKGMMRTRWDCAKLPNPKFFIFKTIDELKRRIDEIGYPCIIKPTYSGGGGRGISVLKSEKDIKWGYEFAFPYVKNDRFICESFVDGMELTIESISILGKVYILAISDKIKPNLRTRVATSLNYPANLTVVQRSIVENVVKKAIISLGIHTGMAHTEVIIHDDKVTLVECGARGGGSHIFPLIIEAVSGINAPVVCGQLLTGDVPVIEKPKRNGVTYRFFNPRKGILREVRGIEEVRSWENVIDVGMLKKPGEEVGDLKNSFERAGHLIVKGKRRKDACDLADQVEKYIEFIVDTSKT